MNNFERLIKRHNNKIIRKNTNKSRNNKHECNCNRLTNCPLNNACLKSNIVYQAEISTVENPSNKKYYIGISQTPFKTRLANHTLKRKV